MSKELNCLTSFMNQLVQSSMRHEDIVARGYDYALAQYRSNEELHMKQGDTISSTLQVQLMDHAADLLKFAVTNKVDVSDTGNTTMPPVASTVH